MDAGPDAGSESGAHDVGLIDDAHHVRSVPELDVPGFSELPPTLAAAEQAWKGWCEVPAEHAGSLLGLNAPIAAPSILTLDTAGVPELQSPGSTVQWHVLSPFGALNDLLEPDSDGIQSVQLRTAGAYSVSLFACAPSPGDCQSYQEAFVACPSARLQVELAWGTPGQSGFLGTPEAPPLTKREVQLLLLEPEYVIESGFSEQGLDNARVSEWELACNGWSPQPSWGPEPADLVLDPRHRFDEKLAGGGEVITLHHPKPGATYGIAVVSCSWHSSEEIPAVVRVWWDGEVLGTTATLLPPGQGWAAATVTPSEAAFGELKTPDDESLLTPTDACVWFSFE